MKILLMFLVASNYFPFWYGDSTSNPYTKLIGVYIEWDSHISLEFVSYTVGGVNDCINVTIEVSDDENVYLYEYQYYDLSGEKLLPLEIDNYVKPVKVNVIVVNFFYPEDVFEYEFVLDGTGDDVYDETEKVLYSGKPYFYSFGANDYLYHKIRFPYYKDVYYIDGNVENYLEYFRFNVDDYYDLLFNLSVLYNGRVYDIDLGYVQSDGINKLYTVDNFYFNPIIDVLDLETNEDNYYISNLKFPIKEELVMTLSISGMFDYSFDLKVIPLVDLFGSCEEAMYCFIVK